MIFFCCKGRCNFASCVNGYVVLPLHPLQVSCEPIAHFSNAHAPNSAFATHEIQSSKLDIFYFGEGNGFALSGGEVITFDFDLFFVDEYILVLVNGFLKHNMIYD